MCRAKFYAGIGSRETPTNIMEAMTRIAERLANCEYILRSGAAHGADTAMEMGVYDWNYSEIWIPWDGYNGRSYLEGPHVHVLDPRGEVMELSSRFHPSWKNCKDGARKLHARNYHIVLGENLHSPVDFIVCWTKDGGEDDALGGTGQAVRIANAHKIPVFNLKNKESRYLLKDKIEGLERLYANSRTQDQC